MRLPMIEPEEWRSVGEDLAGLLLWLLILAEMWKWVRG
jgi:hypothetical protein